MFFHCLCSIRLKRNTENAATLDDVTKKAKLSSYSSSQTSAFNAPTPPPQSPAQVQLHPQLDSPFHSQTGTSQSMSNIMPHNVQQHQPHSQTKRGPGRPKKAQGSIYSPKAEGNIVENGFILSPPMADKRRRASNSSTRTRDEILSSPPPLSNMKAGPVKQKRRASKKDHSTPDPDIQSVASPSARGSSVALSPAPFLPSPARTPGSTSSVSFTHSKDLAANISDLDKLFEGSDDEDELDNTSKVSSLSIYKCIIQCNPFTIDNEVRMKMRS